MDLHARIPVQPGSRKFIARITEEPLDSPNAVRLVRGDEPVFDHSASSYLRLGPTSPDPREIPLPESLSYLSTGDIVRVNQHAGELRVLYRSNSHHNVLFATERCNSRCLMCSQPPRAIDDSYLVDEMLETIPLMSPETKELCITGGEPTLLGDGLLKIIRNVKDHLPQTGLHMLSNGRHLADPRLAKDIADIEHPDFMIGIPLYSDVSDRHDFVVQAKGAFDDTLRGIMNLGRLNQKIEIRFVIHKQTVERLPQTARFIARNLPFVNQVALMGLEMMGFTKSNLEALWIDPYDYQDLLSEAVEELNNSRIPLMIYNHQLCLLRPELRCFAVKSISDWKNIYMDACEGCAAKADCGGFFASAPLRYSSHIQPLELLPSI